MKLYLRYSWIVIMVMALVFLPSSVSEANVPGTGANDGEERPDADEVINEDAYEAEGDFYEEHEEFFDHEDVPPSYAEVLQSYDHSAYELDCGSFSFTCNAYNILMQIGVSAMQWVQDTMAVFVIQPTDIIDEPIYKTYQTALNTVSNTLFAIFIAWQAMKMMSVRLGDSSDAPIVLNEKLVSILVIAIFLFLYDDILTWIIGLQEVAIAEVVVSIEPNEFVRNILFNLIMGGTWFAFIAIAVMGVLLLVLTLQLFYRLAYVGLLYIMGPIAIVTKVNDTYNFFDFWLKQLVTSFLTLFLQILCIALAFQMFSSLPSFFGDVTHIFIGVAFIVLAMGIPRILGEWGSTTGSGRAVMNMGRSASRMILMRR